MIRKIAQLRNLIIILLVAECILLFGLYLLLDSSLLFAFSVYALIKNIILFFVLSYITYLVDTNSMSVSEALDVDAKNAFILVV